MQAYRLSDITTIGRAARDIKCAVCGRRGRYRVATLIERHGDVVLPDVLARVSADCPRRIHAHERCGAVYARVLTIEEEARIKEARGG